VRARIRMQDGREGEGVSAELLVPKWFDKSPDLSHEDNFNQLRTALAVARKHLLAAGENTPFGLSASVEAAIHAECAARKLGGLIASFGLALLDRAILDALGRLENRTIFQLAQENRFGLTGATAPDIAGFDLDRFLAGLRPARTIHARHTVGLVDALTKAETGQAPRRRIARKPRRRRRLTAIAISSSRSAAISRPTSSGFQASRRSSTAQPNPISRPSTATSSITTSKAWPRFGGGSVKSRVSRA
jgi:hypothetical protein